MSWKYPVGFKYIDPSGDLECKVLRRRINDDDLPYYVVEKTYPNLKFFEENVMEDIIINEVNRGLPCIDEAEPQEFSFDLDFESLTPKKRGPKPKPKLPKLVKFEPVVKPPIYKREVVEPKKPVSRPVIIQTGRIELNEDQKRRLSEWRANRK